MTLLDRLYRTLTFILTLIEFQKYNLNILYSLSPCFDKIPDINQKIIKNHFKLLILEETNLSTKNYIFFHYYLTKINLIPLAVENLLKIIAKSFKSTTLYNSKNAKIVDMLRRLR